MQITFESSFDRTAMDGELERITNFAGVTDNGIEMWGWIAESDGRASMALRRRIKDGTRAVAEKHMQTERADIMRQYADQTNRVAICEGDTGFYTVTSSERVVLERLVTVVLADDGCVSVHDGEQWYTRGWRSFCSIMSVARSVGEASLRIRDTRGCIIGTVYIVWGNSAAELICDHTDSPEMRNLLSRVTGAKQ